VYQQVLNKELYQKVDLTYKAVITTSATMHFQRTKPQHLVVILSVMIIFCVYLASLPNSTTVNRESKKNSSETYRPTIVFPVKQQLNIFRYSDIVRHYRSEVPSVLLLSDDKRIYFHETADRDHLNLRQLCAVESAAKKNADRSVQIFFQTNHVNLTVDPLVSILRGYPNIAVILINVTDYFAGTVKYFLYVNAVSNFLYLYVNNVCLLLKSRLKVGTCTEHGDRVRTKRSISPTTSASSVRSKAEECTWISTLSLSNRLTRTSFGISSRKKTTVS
jgi:hypothetical protein